jgi:hypothetical protein
MSWRNYVDQSTQYFVDEEEQGRKKTQIQKFISWYALQISQIRRGYKMRGRDIIEPRANGSPNRNFSKCFVKYLDNTHGEYVGILSNHGMFMNEYTGAYPQFEPDAFYIFVPCQSMLLEKAHTDGIPGRTEIDILYELIIGRGFLEEMLKNARREAAAAAAAAAASVGEDPTPPHRGGRRKKSSKRRLMRRKSVRKLKKD